MSCHLVYYSLSPPFITPGSVCDNSDTQTVRSVRPSGFSRTSGRRGERWERKKILGASYSTELYIKYYVSIVVLISNIYVVQKGTKRMEGAFYLANLSLYYPTYNPQTTWHSSAISDSFTGAILWSMWEKLHSKHEACLMHWYLTQVTHEVRFNLY